MATEGTFVLADIGGYTSFLSNVGLRHGKEITEHLLNRLIKAQDKRWKVANVMGDCVFFYSPTPEPPDRTFASVRALYNAFRDAQLEIADNSTCRCGACDRTEGLSLKFVVHAGEYGIQNIAGRKELIGQDIVIATRLLKNSVPVPEYVVVTPSMSGVIDICGFNASPVRDELDSLGPFDYHYIDLSPIRQQYERDRAFYISEASARLAVIEEIDAPVSVVWDAISNLEKRAVWQVTIETMEHVQGPSGDIGEVHSCVHGSTKIVHVTIGIDHEARRKTERVWISPPIMKDTYITLFADPLPDGRTRAGLLAKFKPKVPVLSHIATPVFFMIMRRMIRKDVAGLKELCETGHVAARETAVAGQSHP